MITIGRPYVTKNDAYARLNVEVDFSGIKKLLFIECEKAYEPYLVYECADAYLVLLVYYAMRNEQDITSVAPVSKELVHNLKEFLIPSLIMGGKNVGTEFHQVEIIAPLASSISFFSNANAGAEPQGVVACMSGGVDSFYTAKKYLSENAAEKPRLTHFYFGNVSIDVTKNGGHSLEDFIHANRNKHEKVANIAGLLGLPLVTTFSNFLSYEEKPEPYMHEVIAEIMCFRKLFKIFCLPSNLDFSEYSLEKGIKYHDQGYYELLTSYVITIPGFQLICSGAGHTRFEKVKELMDYDIAKKELDTCFFQENGKNCSKPTCSKCLRTLCALDVCDKLDEFKDVFDVQQYRLNYQDYLREFYRRYKSPYSSNMFKELYEPLKEKYPEDFEELENRTGDTALRSGTRRSLW